jgi:malonate decarboxylase beta subunit
MDDLRRAIGALLDQPVALTLESVRSEHRALGRRLDRFGTAGDATDIWKELGVQEPAAVPMLGRDDFLSLVDPLRERSDV